ncbi:MAG: FAD-binding oxidoreductase [Myxococcota bacterium]|nr:FAD-binding oxidoreductase [Myxococcota bacterium]
MADSTTTRRSFWGWGNENGGPDSAQQEGIRATMEQRLGGALELAPAPKLDDLDLPTPRIKPPAALAERCSTDPFDRAGHTYGKSFRDIVRGARGDFSSPPDFVAFPEDESEIVSLLDWATDNRIGVVPYGGGSSVVGGVESILVGDQRGVISLDLSRLDQVLEIDRTSRAARIQAGVYGPALENTLRPHGLTLRHFPQSFEFSTLGGWIATRSGGHYATLYTHIDDFVEGMRVITPSGSLESRRLPGTGAGPSPDRLFLGSEGSLGIITEAWMRLQDRPTYRASATARFTGQDGFLRGAEAVRALAQSGLAPTNCRLLDAGEALQSGAGNGEESVLVLGFESADHGLEAWMTRAVDICRDAGGDLPESAVRLEHKPAASGDGGAQREGAAGAWRNAFLRAPYVRDALVRMAVICETFETAVTWDHFPEFHAGVTRAVKDAIDRVCGSGTVNCRFTHAYPDGAAPYYSVMAPGKRGSELEQWAEIKAAASDALIAHGGTITHHHAVGRDHRPWYDTQRPDLFGRALAATKRELDPGHIMNPGVVID